MRAGPRIDRWVLPPAIAAAVFALLAAAPAGGSLGERLRVEGFQTGEGAPWLVRAAWEHPNTGGLRAPRELRVRAAGRSVRVQGVRGAVFAWAMLPGAQGAGELGVWADGHGEARVKAPRARRAVLAGAQGELSSGVVVQGGELITESPGVVLVRAPGAVAVRVEPELDGVEVSPRRAEVDGCGVASFEVRVEALGAPVRVVTEPGERVSHRVLPLRPGGIGTRWNGAVFEARSAAGVGRVFMVGGRRGEVTAWTELGWEREGDGAVARWSVPEGVSWALASASLSFAEPSGGARQGYGESPGCTGGEASRRWFAARERLPWVEPPEVLWDGVARAREARETRRKRVHTLGFFGLALSLGAEVVLVMGAGLSGDAQALRGVSEPRRKRLGVLTAMILTIAVAGMAFALSGWMSGQ